MRLNPWRRRRRRTSAEWMMPQNWRTCCTRGSRNGKSSTPPSVPACMTSPFDLFARMCREAARGASLDDEMRVLIAAQACLLLLGLDRDSFAGITSVIVHQRPVVLRGDCAHDVAGVRVEGPQMLDGQATYRGPVLLSWPAVASGARFPQRWSQRRVPRVRASNRHARRCGRRHASNRRPRGAAPLGCCLHGRVQRGTCWTRLTGAQGLRRGQPRRVLRGGHRGVLCLPLELRTHETRAYDEMAGFYRQDPASRAERAASDVRAAFDVEPMIGTAVPRGGAAATFVTASPRTHDAGHDDPGVEAAEGEAGCRRQC